MGLFACLGRNKMDKKIFVLDDDEHIAGFVRIMLETLGYDVIVTNNARDAKEVFEQMHDEIVLAILDLNLNDGHNGLEVYAWFKEINPKLKAVFITGFDTGDLPGEGTLAKPFGMDAIKSLLKKVIG